jgi:hypothetical protein
MSESPEKYQWIKYAVLPIMAALYPFLLPLMEKAYGIEDTKREAVKTEINEVISSEETLESLSKKIEEHNKYYSETIDDLNNQIAEFNRSRNQWSTTRAIVLRRDTLGNISYTAFDGNTYPVYWYAPEKVWKYVKNGRSYEIFKIEE